MTQATRRLRGRYELLEVLGGGSGSATHRALDHETDTHCVVKVLSVGEVVRGASRVYSYDSDDFTKLVELFEREARVLSQLDHPGIPRFIDHFTEVVDDDTRLYTVQEHVPGRTLQQHIEAGRHFTEVEARDLCGRVAEILAHLHGRSPPLIHRDIKPSNVVLGDDGSVHLVDFGSVRNAVGGDELDGRTIVGTYGYMPVEQYEARALPQSDLYALGMTLVYALSHREPTRIPRLGMRLDFRPTVNVSEGFAGVLERMIEPAPEDRFETAGSLLAALDRRVATPALAGAPKQRARIVAVSVAGVLVTLGGLVSFLMVGPLGFGPTEPPEPAPGPTARPQPVVPVDGRLTVDIFRDFGYAAVGWPMGRSVGQTALPALTEQPFEDLRLPREWRAREADVWHGFFPLGNGSDSRVAFALVRDAGVWSLHVDLDNDEDLTDGGPAVYNEGTGEVLAAEVAPTVDIVRDDGSTVRRPYHLWVWFDEPDASGRIRGRFYARNHYRGEIQVGDLTYRAVAFEFRDHDALYRDSGLCLDLDGDEECAEATELFRDGDVVRFPTGEYPLALRYP